MDRSPIFGLKFRIVLALAAVLTGFILLTELSVSELTRVMVTRLAETCPSAAMPQNDQVDFAQALLRLRRLVFFYLVVGAAVALVLGALAVNRLVVTPLGRINLAIRRVAEGSLDTTVPMTGGRELAALGRAFNDMTARLRSQQLEIAQRIAELETSATALAQTQDRLIRAAKLASVGTLAAGVAHEIGNPLAGLLGLIEAMETDAAPETKQRYRDLMRAELERIDRIIRDLLAYARPPRGDEVERSADIREVLRNAFVLLSAQKLFDGVTLSQHGLDTPTAVGISRDDLTQIFINMLLNAAEAMEGRGEVDVEAEAIADWRLTPGASPTAAVRIHIRDSGPGVPPEDAPRIFDPFFSKRTRLQGCGLGLAVCHSLCDRAGGDIALDLSPEHGAHFQITLPARAHPAGRES